jgi:hypothetical protein
MMLLLWWRLLIVVEAVHEGDEGEGKKVYTRTLYFPFNLPIKPQTTLKVNSTLKCSKIFCIHPPPPTHAQ